MKIAEVEPGDILLIHATGEMTVDAVTAIKDRFSELFPGVHIIITQPGIGLTVVQVSNSVTI